MSLGFFLCSKLDENIAQARLHCYHRHLLYLVLIALLLPLPRGFSLASRIEHIPKYSSIEKFMKLPFQQVPFALDGVQTRELWPFYFSAVCCPENFRVHDLRCFGHNFLYETSIGFILDSLEPELHGAFEYPKICCYLLLRSSWTLMRTISSCEFIRRCQWSRSCGLWSVVSCVPRLQGHHHWFTSKYHGFNDVSSPLFLLYPWCRDWKMLLCFVLMIRMVSFLDSITRLEVYRASHWRR